MTFKVNSAYGQEYECRMTTGFYHNGDQRIQIFCKEDGADFYEPFATLTVAIENSKLSIGEIVVDTNNLSNTNVVEVLEELKCMEKTGWYLYSGYCTYPVYRLLPAFERYCDKN